MCSLALIGKAVCHVWNVFSYYRMCSPTIECVLLAPLALIGKAVCHVWNVFSYYRMCSPTIECVLLL